MEKEEAATLYATDCSDITYGPLRDAFLEGVSWAEDRSKILLEGLEQIAKGKTGMTNIYIQPNGLELYACDLANAIIRKYRGEE